MSAFTIRCLQTVVHVSSIARGVATVLLQSKPWLGIDLGRPYEVESVTLTAAPAGAAGWPAYNSSHKFTVRVGNVAPVANVSSPDSGLLDRRCA